MTTNRNSRQVIDDLDKGPDESRWIVADLLQSSVRCSTFPDDWVNWPPDVLQRFTL
jgi:hypothetical protein